MLKSIVEFASLLLVLAIIVCLVAIGGTWLSWQQQRAQASKALETNLNTIDLHFNANLSLFSPSLSTDAIFPPTVNMFTRESINSGNTYSPCNESADYEQATYRTIQGTAVVLAIYHCRDKPTTPTLNKNSKSPECGDNVGILRLRETVRIPYIYGTCPAMFSGAESFAGMITWANGGSVFSLNGYGHSKETMQFLHDYPY